MKTTLTILFLSMIQIAECQQTIYDLWKEADEIVETFHFDLDKNIDGNYIVNVRHYKESGVYFTKNYSNVYKTIGELLSYCGFNYNHQNDTLLFSFHYNEFEVWRVSVYSKNQEVKYYFSWDENKLTEIPKEEFSEVDLYVENIEKTIFENMAPTLMMWDIFRYYLTTSHNNRKINNGPFPYIRAELDRQQRKVFQTTFKKVIKVLNEFTDLKIISIPDMDLILYEKFKFEKQSKNSNILFNYPALGAGLIHEHGNIEIETIGNVLNINDSKIKKELKNIEHIRKPKSAKSKKFLDLIKK